MTNIWCGNNVRLRTATADDAVLFIDENGDYNTDTARKYDYIEFPLTKEQISEKLTSFSEKKQNSDDFCFVIETIEHQRAGFILTFDCDKRNGSFKYGIFLHDDFKGKGVASEAVKIILNYYFNELRYHKVNVYIYDYNTPSIKFHEKLGFKNEGRLREAAYSNGCYHDIVFYGMLKNEFNSANPLPKL